MTKEEKVKLRKHILEVQQAVLENKTELNFLFAISTYLSTIAIILLDKD